VRAKSLLAARDLGNQLLLVDELTPEINNPVFCMYIYLKDLYVNVFGYWLRTCSSLLPACLSLYVYITKQQHLGLTIPCSQSYMANELKRKLKRKKK